MVTKGHRLIWEHRHHRHDRHCDRHQHHHQYYHEGEGGCWVHLGEDEQAEPYLPHWSLGPGKDFFIFGTMFSYLGSCFHIWDHVFIFGIIMFLYLAPGKTDGDTREKRKAV